MVLLNYFSLLISELSSFIFLYFQINFNLGILYFSVGSNDISQNCTVEDIVSHLECLKNIVQQTGAHCLVGEIPCKSSLSGMTLNNTIVQQENS